MKLITVDLKNFLQNIYNKIQSLADNVLEKIPEEKRRLFIFSFGGFVFLVICLAFAVLAMNRGNSESLIVKNSPGIPSDELFYPAEPDFLPALMLEKEPYPHWTSDDILLFWIDPGKGNEEEWLQTAKNVIDKLMENVQ